MKILFILLILTSCGKVDHNVNKIPVDIPTEYSVIQKIAFLDMYEDLTIICTERWRGDRGRIRECNREMADELLGFFSAFQGLQGVQ